MGVFHVPESVIIGAGERKNCANYLPNLSAKRVLLVCDPGVISLGFHSDVEASLKEAGFDVAIFDGIQPDPTDKNIAAGVEAVKAHDAQALIAVGGGSVMDACKVIALAAKHGLDIRSWMGIENIPERGLPFICIPTTAGTGSEVTKVAVITDTENHVKMMMLSRYLLPTAAIVDFELSMSMPPALTAAVGVDTLTHGLEAYVSRKAHGLTDPIALSCIQLSAQYLEAAWQDGSNREARAAMQLAACQGGMAFANSSVALVHGMSRPIGAHFHLPHGLSNAVLLPTVTEWSLSGASERYAHVARLINCADESDNDAKACDKLVSNLDGLNKRLEIPRLGESISVAKDEFTVLAPSMANDAIASGSPGNNPRQPNAEDIVELYQQAW